MIVRLCSTTIINLHRCSPEIWIHPPLENSPRSQVVTIATYVYATMLQWQRTRSRHLLGGEESPILTRPLQRPPPLLRCSSTLLMEDQRPGGRRSLEGSSFSGSSRRITEKSQRNGRERESRSAWGFRDADKRSSGPPGMENKSKPQRPQAHYRGGYHDDKGSHSRPQQRRCRQGVARVTDDATADL